MSTSPSQTSPSYPATTTTTTTTTTSSLHLPTTSSPPSSLHPPKPLTWLVFGATGHMGRSVAKSALAHSDRVCAVGRTFENSLRSMQNWHGDENRYLGLLCDVRVRQTVQDVILRCLEHFGAIDIIAVCSGYGVIGACEDQEDYEIRNQFETNFLGTLNILQLSLPYFRKRRQGRYLVFSSTSGALGVPGLGPYCATKYAVEGLIESMLYEVDNFNIKATLVEPGHLARDDVYAFAQGNGGGAEGTDELPIFGHFRVKPPSEPYQGKEAPAAHAKRMLAWLGDNQPTSARRGAELVWQLGHCKYPPLRLLLGTFAVESIRDRLKSIIEEIEDWKHLNFPPVEGTDVDGEGQGDEEKGDDGEDTKYGEEQHEDEVGEEEGVDEKEDRDGTMGLSKRMDHGEEMDET